MRKLLFSLVLLTLVSTFAFSQNGAEVYRGDYFDWFFLAPENVLLFGSNSPDICNGSEDDWMARLKIVDNKNSEHDQLTGFYYMYVFDPMTVDEFIAAGGLCPLLEAGDERLVAEGIGKGSWIANDWYGEKNAYTDGWGYNGVLYDMTGVCASGMVEFNYKVQIRCNKGNGCKVNRKGPRYSCYVN